MNRAIPAALAGLLAALLLSARHSQGQTAAAGDPAAPAAQESVVGLSVRGANRAYPTALFSQRRVVNDVIGDLEVAIFHDPERGLSAAWFRMVHGEPIEFSGAATGTVADDLTTVTRWDLATGVAVGGNLQGQKLVALPVLKTSWAGWAAAHPNAQIYRDGR
jgi:hypothetical protein